MPLDDLLVANPNPASVDMPVRCKHCQHFERIPFYKINGAPTVCSDEAKIGRKANQVPCPNFMLDTLIIRDTSPDTKVLIVQLTAQLQHELGTTRAGVDGLLYMSIVLRNLYQMGRAGLHIGRVYSVANTTIVGKLTAYNGAQSTLETDTGLPYTVLTRDLVAQTTKPAAPKRPSARA